MENAHKRKKQPEVVRRALLDAAARIAVEQGLAAVTVQSVADAAGVTKGGFLHHFPSKQALLDTLFQEMLDQIDDNIDRRMVADPVAHGTFTRAYLEAVLHDGLPSKVNPWAALSVSMLTEPELRTLWVEWFRKRLDRHRETDADIGLAIVRLAADGIWLADLAELPLPDRARLRERLLEATRPR
ncbi:TetR/AcrR family transcriptional regulator [Aquamicrobium sp. LC103]|uniref:TetR/AcrR family transcriptional regulator n=1 Tax=Aquamicrobium sp. LC103 TaxID=1120658 RepID=UPI00063E7E9A|nr:TetR/AcrR family transcriptional regulator [Aquamicrobium sp. LC103]TKT80313.1 TetR/AcrR family transcriptional regulator [Aquamicrobium sp. LC103]